MSSLYQLGAEERDLEALLIAQEGVVTPEQQAQWDNVAAQIEVKVDGYYHVSRNHDATADALEAEAKTLMTRAAAHRKIAERCRERLQSYMQAHMLDTLKGATHTATLGMAGGQQALKVLVPVEALPKAYVREVTKVFVNQEALRAALKQKTDVSQYCTLEPRKITLEFK